LRTLPTPRLALTASGILLIPASSEVTSDFDSGENVHLENQHHTAESSSSSSVVCRLRPGLSYSGPEVLSRVNNVDSGRLPLDGIVSGRLPTSSSVSTGIAKKDGPHTPTASKACPPAEGRAGSAYDGESTTKAMTRTADLECIPPSKRACTAQIDHALQHDADSKDRARKPTASRLTRLLMSNTFTERPADERARSRSK
jgi:hypothetical protein